MCWKNCSWFHPKLVPRTSTCHSKHLTQHKIKYFRSFNAAFDLDDTLESDGNVNLNRSLSLSPAKKTKKFEVLQNPDLEVQFADSVCFAGLYFLPIPFFFQKESIQLLQLHLFVHDLSLTVIFLKFQYTVPLPSKSPVQKFFTQLLFVFVALSYQQTTITSRRSSSWLLRNSSPRPNQQSTVKSLSLYRTS